MNEKPENNETENDDPLGLNATFALFANLTEAEEAEITRKASNPQPQKTAKVEAYDYELGWVEEWVTVKPLTNEPSPIVAFLRSMKWS